MKSYYRNGRLRHKVKFRYDGQYYDYLLPLICDADDKKIYRQYSYFHNCFNCSYFHSLSSSLDYCKLSGFTCKYDDLPCIYFKPIKYSWFYRDFKKE